MLEIDYYRSSDEEIIRKCLEELKDELQSKTDMRLWEYHDGVCIIMVEVNSSFLYSFNVQYVIKRSIEYANNHRNMEMMVSAAISITTTIEQLLDVYHQMQRVIQDKFYNGPGSIYCLNDELEGGSSVEEKELENLKK